MILELKTQDLWLHRREKDIIETKAVERRIRRQGDDRGLELKREKETVEQIAALCRLTPEPRITSDILENRAWT